MSLVSEFHILFFSSFTWIDPIPFLRYLKSNLKMVEKIMQMVVELVLILTSVKEMGEMRMNLIFIKVEVMDQVGVNLLGEVSLI